MQYKGPQLPVLVFGQLVMRKPLARLEFFQLTPKSGAISLEMDSGGIQGDDERLNEMGD
jgi:hypothetical protein